MRAVHGESADFFLLASVLEARLEAGERRDGAADGRGLAEVDAREQAVAERLGAERGTSTRENYFQKNEF